MTQKFLIIDFDSTLIEVEALDELAALALSGHPEGEEIAKEIARVTNLGMEGKISIDESLERRIKLLQAGKAEVEAITAVLKQRISASFKANAAFFKRNRDRIFVISNGFEDYIVPVVGELFIKSQNVFANRFTYSPDDQIIGYDKENLLAQSGGKSKQLLELDLEGEVYVIGDGYTDLQMTETGCVTKFFAYVGNVNRPGIAEKADHVIESFGAFLSLGYFQD